MEATNDIGYFPYTPPTPLLHGLRASLDLLLAEGLPQVYARHHRLAEGVRHGVAALGLELCATDPVWESDTVTAIRVPDDVDSDEVVRIAYERYRTSFGGGLSKVAGRGVPDRPPRRLQRGDVPDRAGRRRDLAQRRRRQGRPRRGRRGGPELLPGLLQRVTRERGARDEPHPAPPAPGPPAAQRARRAGLQPGVHREGRRQRGRLRVPRPGGRGRAPGEGAGPQERRRGPARHRLARPRQDRLGAHQRARHALHVPRRHRRDGAGRRPRRHPAGAQGRGARRPLRRRGAGRPGRAGQGLRHSRGAPRR